MKTLKTIQEGFYRNTGSGKESHISNLVKKCGIKNYEIQPDFKVLVKDVDVVITTDDEELGFDMITEVPINIYLTDCKNLKTLKGLPSDIAQLFLIRLNKLETLEGCSSLIHSRLGIDSCPNLTSLKSSGIEYVDSIILMKLPKLKNLKDLNVDCVNLSIIDCGVTSLEGCPKDVSSLKLSKLQFDNFRGCPKIISSSLEVRDCEFKDFRGFSNIKAFCDMVIDIPKSVDFKYFCFKHIREDIDIKFNIPGDWNGWIEFTPSELNLHIKRGLDADPNITIITI